MRKFLYLLCLLSFSVTADQQYTLVEPGVKIYSEYYKSPTTKFPGTIIFENGSGTSIREWKANKQFLQCAKKLGSVFFYDRSGLGKSPPDFSVSVKNPLTPEKISQRLWLLLKKRNIRGPYIFVAHSYGAVYSGYFILKHPVDVKGVLLVDPVPRYFNTAQKFLDKYKKKVGEAKVQPARYIYHKYGGSKAEVIYQLLSFRTSQASLHSLGDIDERIPVVILSTTVMEKIHPLTEDWYKSQKQWLNKNPQSKIVTISSGHFIQLAHPHKVCEALSHVLRSM